MSGPDAFAAALVERCPPLQPIGHLVARAARETWEQRGQPGWLPHLREHISRQLDEQRDRMCRLLDDPERMGLFVETMASTIYRRIRERSGLADGECPREYIPRWIACAQAHGVAPEDLRTVDFLTWREGREG